MATEQQRALQIKRGTVTRLCKELVMYKDEVSKETLKVQKLKNENADPYDIKYAENILEESIAMVPDTHQRLKSAVKDLQEFLEENQALFSDSPDIATTNEQVATALSLLEA